MKIGWIGTGVMGAPMAGHLLAAGHQITVYSRTRTRAESLIEAGAAWADTPREAATGCDAVFCMVGFPSDVREVILSEQGALAGMIPGSLLIDFTTSSPALAEEIAETAAAQGVEALDAPVSGGDVGARNAGLSIMVGGSRAAFDRALPLLKALGKTVVHQGRAGSGQHTKMVNQTIIAGTMIGICEALVYAKRSGLDPEQVLKSVGGGAAQSWSLLNLWPRILQDDFDPGFFIEHFVKDMGIALQESQRMGLTLPGLELVHGIYQRLVDSGSGRLGTQALIQALEPDSPCSPPSS